MRLVSYNILEGGEGRADPLAEVMLAQRPDIVAVIEADVPSVVERIAKRLEMDHVVAENESGNAVALFSRWTIRDSANVGLLRGGMKKNFLRATVVDPTGREWPIGVVHLAAHAAEENERAREFEIQIVLDAFADLRAAGTPHLLVGDFNSNSPVQQFDPHKAKQRTRDEVESNGGTLPRRVISAMLAAGYVDTLHAADALDAETAGTFSTQHPGQRVDYIFAFGIEPSAIRSAWIETDRLAKYASDHFPVGVEND